jgi:hypothetical protein
LKKRSYTQLPTFVWNPVGEASAQGHDAVRASVARWKGAWDEYEVTHEEFVDAGDRVVVTLHLRGRGRGSGVEIDARFFDVYTIRVVLAVVAPHGVRIVGAQPWFCSALKTAACHFPGRSSKLAASSTRLHEE